MTLAGSLALSYLCQWLRLAPAERHAGRGGGGGRAHAAALCATLVSLARISRPRRGRARPEKVVLASSQVSSQTFLRESQIQCD